MRDDDLVRAWEACTLSGSGISHIQHVRIAWVLLSRYGRAEGAQRLLDGTRANCEAYGILDRFDETLTRQWAEAIADAIGTDTTLTEFQAFAAAHPHLLRSDLFRRRVRRSAGRRRRMQ